jgi:dipeptidyl aminopeptidase/acylaminoacyl peptidase
VASASGSRGHATNASSPGPERIAIPLLLIHGTGDDRVRADDALELASKLQLLGRPFELAVFDGDGHGVPAHKLEMDRDVIDWFNRHRH